MARKRRDLFQQIVDCRRCKLHGVGEGPIPGDGFRSPTMLIGEAPGRQEDKEGYPFVGPAGQLLFEKLAAAGLQRDQVFVANAVCCYPTYGRTPADIYIAACQKNLRDQIEWCNPRRILVLGNTALRAVHWPEPVRQPLGAMRGLWYRRENLGGADRWIFVTYHPAAVLRKPAFNRIWREDLEAFVQGRT